MAASDPGSPLADLSPGDVRAEDGALRSRLDPARRDEYTAVLRRAGAERIEADGELAPDDKPGFELHSFGAIFAQVRVDVQTGVIRVPRLCGVFDAGRVVNPRTARSQLEGAMIAGLGGALTEESYFDPSNGRAVVRSLADYHIPAHAGGAVSDLRPGSALRPTPES